MNTYDGNEVFYKYYEKWIEVYKEGAIRNSTMQKYKLTLKWLKDIAPNLKIKEINRITYQEILNKYAENHERQSTMDFHHQLKASILDLFNVIPLCNNNFSKLCVSPGAILSKSFPYVASGLFTV